MNRRDGRHGWWWWWWWRRRWRWWWQGTAGRRYSDNVLVWVPDARILASDDCTFSQACFTRSGTAASSVTVDHRCIYDDNIIYYHSTSTAGNKQYYTAVGLFTKPLIHFAHLGYHQEICSCTIHNSLQKWVARVFFWLTIIRSRLSHFLKVIQRLHRRNSYNINQTKSIFLILHFMFKWKLSSIN